MRAEFTRRTRHNLNNISLSSRFTHHKARHITRHTRHIKSLNDLHFGNSTWFL